MLNSEELINKVKSYNKFLNPTKLDKAYNFAVKAHKNQKRDSGDPYSNHPIAVANILTELKLEFSSKDLAINYAKKKKIEYELIEPRKRKTVKKSYADNFLK